MQPEALREHHKPPSRCLFYFTVLYCNLYSELITKTMAF